MNLERSSTTCSSELWQSGAFLKQYLLDILNAESFWDYSQGCQCLWIILWQWCPREKVPPGLSRCNQMSLVSVSKHHLSSQFKWVKVSEGQCIVISFLLFWKVWSLVSRLFRTSGFHFYPLFKNKEIKQINFYLFIIKNKKELKQNQIIEKKEKRHRGSE